MQQTSQAWNSKPSKKKFHSFYQQQNISATPDKKMKMWNFLLTQEKYIKFYPHHLKSQRYLYV
jgi:hypothetical protein